MKRLLARHGGAVLLVAACTAAAIPLHHRFELTNLTMIYLLGVVIVALAFGRGPAILASVLSVATFDWVFVPPRYTFEVEDAQFLVTFVVMLVVALVIGSLTARVREELAFSRARERRTSALYGLSRELASRSDAAEILAIAVQRAAEVLSAKVAVLRSTTAGDMETVAGDTAIVSETRDREAARRALENGQIAGLEQWNTEPWILHIPLDAGVHIHGVMSARPLAGGWDPERLQLLRTLASQTALALERCRLAEASEKTRVEVETERARNAMLSSVSHDLRTPLAAMLGAATSLRDDGGRLSPEARHELADTIADEAGHLNRLVGNVLDVTRLESGSLTPRRAWNSLEEIVASALDHFEPQLAGRELALDVPEGLPLVFVDDVLLGQLVTNLVDNALRYTPAGSPIEIAARVESGTLRIEVSDRGPGLGAGEESRVFDRGHRGARETDRHGAGLGLTICRGIAEVHGGTIRAETRSGGGVRFVVRIPLSGTAPPVVDEEGAA